MEFGGGNVEQDKEETTDWQEAMQGVKFQGVKTFKSGGNEFLIPPTPEAETSEALKNPGIIGTFKNFLAEKFGSKKAGTGLLVCLENRGRIYLVYMGRVLVKKKSRFRELMMVMERTRLYLMWQSR